MRNLLLMAVLSILLSSCVAKPEMRELLSSCDPYVSGEVYFEQGKSAIPSSQNERINQLIEVTTKFKIQLVLIVGLSDSSEQNEEKQNQLSIQRAKAIADYVVLKNPTLQGVVHFEGKGSKFPVSGGEASKNRRADIEILLSSCKPIQ